MIPFITFLFKYYDISELISGLSVMGSQSDNMIELFARLVQQLQNAKIIQMILHTSSFFQKSHLTKKKYLKKYAVY